MPNVFRAYAFDNAKLKAFILMADDLMLGESGLSKAEREMIAVAVSAVNHCHYCLTSHGAALRQRGNDPELGELIAQNYRAAEPGSRARRRCSTSAAKLTEAPDKIEEADREALRRAGFSRPRHLGHRRRRQLLQHVQPHGRGHRHEAQPGVPLYGAGAPATPASLRSGANAAVIGAPQRSRQPRRRRSRRGE